MWVNVLSTVDGGFFDGGKAQIWSATEQAGGLGMITSCMKSNVFMYNSNKKNLMKYRCVRDLP